MTVFLLVSMMGVSIESSRPYWLKNILDSAGNSQSSAVTLYFLLFCTSLILASFFSSLTNYLGDRTLIPLLRQTREAVFKKVLDLDFAYHVNKSTGALISVFKRGEGAIDSIFESIFKELYKVCIYLIVTLYLLTTLSPAMAAILLIIFLIILLIIVWLIKINLKKRAAFNAVEDEVSGVITDSILNYETVKLFAAESKEIQHLSSKFDIWIQKIWSYANSFRLMDICIGTISSLGITVIIWLAISKLNKGFTIGDLVMVTGLLTSLYYQFFGLFMNIRNIAKHLTDMEKYFLILSEQTQVKDPNISMLSKQVSGQIDFENVSFTYPKNNDAALKDVTFTIQPGKQVAFVGRSGAGKTTLVKLLLRFYDPEIGRILIDGIDIKQMTKNELRLLLGIVPQEPVMFNKTLKYNLSYGKPNANLEEISAAAKKANILDFIENLPDKWDTEVGERGIKLSGGQKQRLAIARALLTNPKVLIFDEATSNLDSESELKIQEALASAAKERTVIVIAHRFSTIRNADKIIVLSEGCVVEEGKHKQLLNKKGIYSLLWSLQAKGKMLE